MEKFMINGGRRLSGKLKIESAKNSVLPIIAASILTNEQVIIKNCPKIADVYSMLKILKELGVDAYFEDSFLVINGGGLNNYVIPENLAKELRSSIFLMGALISRVKKADLFLPGGCDIGKRPIDLHLKALKEMGVSVLEVGNEVICSTKGVNGKSIRLDYPSVGATENLMLAAVFAKGKTEIHNCAKEPEIVDLMQFLNSMGAKIYGAGTSTVLIEGVDKLHGTTYLPISDRIETGTYLIAAAITGGEVELSNCNLKNIYPLIHKLCDNTCKFTLKNDIIHLKSGRCRNSFSFSTGPYPFFPTDLQAQTMALLAVSTGRSIVSENVFETRFNHVSELLRMGANIDVKGKNALIIGVERLHGSIVNANDLRGGAALVLAGLNAEGCTEINGIKHIERGYFNFDKKLASLGAEIKKIN